MTVPGCSLVSSLPVRRRSALDVLFVVLAVGVLHQGQAWLVTSMRPTDRSRGCGRPYGPSAGLEAQPSIGNPSLSLGRPGPHRFLPSKPSSFLLLIGVVVPAGPTVRSSQHFAPAGRAGPMADASSA